MFFDAWADVLRVVVVGTAAYVALVVVLRLSGKRTLAELNAFDLVVTVALGSTLATILLSPDVAWAEGVTAMLVLVLLQLLVSWSTSLLGPGRSVVTAAPATVLRDGVLDQEAIATQRLTAAEVRQAVRGSGEGGLDQVARVVLETDGTLSVIRASALGDATALEPDDR
ncbi:DUF421 domain-containing protein [Cellulomonas xylanilytica]|uniref:DUF421 domain-containing protein n=1 Tax=Cellulomonas xylanilytica TaxID=233583 RepID=A0A510V795_9CELL|nr:YetF domain-containing protein [Cellulomonas xylanilytica]GEK21015.1 DUF421 domain-containing protein [Cellulomonas xylanilytica]